jgi:hypothetical protein
MTIVSFTGSRPCKRKRETRVSYFSYLDHQHWGKLAFAEGVGGVFLFCYTCIIAIFSTLSPCYLYLSFFALDMHSLGAFSSTLLLIWTSCIAAQTTQADIAYKCIIVISHPCILISQILLVRLIFARMSLPHRNLRYVVSRLESPFLPM